MPTNVPKMSSKFSIELLLKSDSSAEKDVKQNKCITKSPISPIEMPLKSSNSEDFSREVSPVHQMPESDNHARYMNYTPSHPRIPNASMQQPYQQQLPFTPPDNLLSLNAMQQHQQILNTQLQMAAALNYQYNASIQPQAMNFSQIFSNNFHRTSYHMQRFPYAYGSGKQEKTIFFLSFFQYFVLVLWLKFNKLVLFLNSYQKKKEMMIKSSFKEEQNNLHRLFYCLFDGCI